LILIIRLATIGRLTV